MVGIVATNGAQISTAETTTGWNGDTFSLEPDIKVQGSNSVSCAQTNNGTNDLYFAGTFNLSSTQHLRLFWNIAYVGNLSTSNPVQVFLSDGTNTDYFNYFTSNADYAGGWVDIIVVVNSTNFPTVTLSSITQIGIRVNTSTKPRNVVNCWVDWWRYADGIVCTSDTTEAFNFSDIAAANAVSGSELYYCTEEDGVIFAPCKLLIGNNTTANANFVSSNEIVVFPDRDVDTGLYAFITQEGTGNTDIDIDGLIMKTVGGTDAEFTINSSLNSLSFTNSSLIDMGNIVITPIVTSPTISGNSFTNCGTLQINKAASNLALTGCGQTTITALVTLTNCSWVNSTSANSVSINTLTKISGCSFESDGSNHAVELTSLGSGTMNWDGHSLTGYAGTDGSTGNEALYVNVGSGSITINVINGADTPSVRTAGATVTVVAGAVDVTVTSVEEDGDPVGSARVLLKASDGTGPFPFDETVTATSSGTTVTVTHTSHGMATNDYIQITGANEKNYNGIFQITVTGTNTYTFTATSTPSATPATGTLKATFVALTGLTNASTGVLTTSRAYPSNQPVVGWTRKSSAAPYLKQGVLTGTINSSSGFNGTGVMVLDE